MDKRIPVKFESLLEAEKDTMLKTLLVLVFKDMPEEFPILKTYAHYGAEAFDDMIDIEEDKNTYYFKRKFTPPDAKS